MTHTRTRFLAAFVAVTLVGAVTAPAPAVAAPDRAAAAIPGGPHVTYAHDPAGRLSAVFDTAGNGSKIAHDAAGNITSVTRLPATALAVAEVSPPAAKVGASIDIYATRIGTDPQAVTVDFNGTSTHPSEIGGNRMAVAVPAGATSGTLTVTAAGQSAGWPGFQVAGLAAPTITAVSPGTPTIVDPDDPNALVTVTGTGFDPNPMNNRVEVNANKVQVIAATTTQLTLRMPQPRLAGALRVNAAGGESAAGPDVIEPPKGFVTADVGRALRLPVPTTSPVAVNRSTGKISLALFDLPAGQHATVQVNSATTTYDAFLWAPDRRQISAQSPASGVKVFSVPPPRQGGTFELLVSAAAATVTVGVFPDAEASVTVDGSAVSQTTSGGYSRALFHFTGTAGQRVYAAITGLNQIVDAWLEAPGGARLESDSVISTATDTLNGITLPYPGQYTVVVAPDSTTSTFAATVAVRTAAVNPTGTTTVDGTPVTLTMSSVAQVGSVTFAGTTGQRVWIQLTTSSGNGASFRRSLFAPNGANLHATFQQTLTLPMDGVYTVYVDPEFAGTGSATVAVTSVPADAQITAPPDGQPHSASVVFGQNAVASIQIPASTTGHISIHVGVTWPAPICGGIDDLVLTDPGGHQVGNPAACVANIASVAVSANTLYHLAITPRPASAGTLSVTVTQVSAAAHTPAAPKEQPEPVPPRPRPTGQFAPPADQPRADGVPVWSWQAPPPGTPATLTGTVLRTDGVPIGGVRVSLANRATRTDPAGRFRLTRLPAGGGVLTMDGRPASRGGRAYGVYQAHVGLRAGVNRLPFTPYLPGTDTAHQVTVGYPVARDTVLTNPAIPGLEVHIPAGARITDVDGRPVRRVGITPIPVGRPPIPMPDGVQVPVYYSVQPAGGRVTGGDVRIVYPNYQHAAPGSRVDFWHYEKDGDGWGAYGTGHVDGHGYQVRPDPGTVLHDFDGAMISVSGLVKDLARALKDALGLDGDPVDLGSGLFQFDQTDLAVDDVLPLQLTRSYNSGSGRTRAFGVGFNDTYDAFLTSDHQYTEADLNMPNGSQVHFTRTSAGSSFNDAIMTASGSPTDYRNAVLAWNGGGWDLRRRDGTVLVYGDVAPLQSIRDRLGNTITLFRTAVNEFGSQDGDLLYARSSNGAWLRFSYGATAPGGRKLVTLVEDSTGRSVSYGYDTSGRLHTVTDAAGGVTTYGYDSGNRITSVNDARQHTYLTNVYDANGRVHQQTVNGGTYTFDYTLTGGQVTSTTVTDPLGHVRTASFDGSGYLVDDTAAVGTPRAEHIHIDRDATSHIPTDFVNPLGNKIHSSYDADGRPLTTTTGISTASSTSSATYHGPLNRTDTLTDTNGKITTLGYDPAANLASVTDPLNHQTTATYRPDGQLLTLTDPAHGQHSIGYAHDGQPATITDPAGNTTAIRRDAANRPVTTVLPTGLTATVSYDSANRITASTDGAGNTTRYGYDENGNLHTLTDPNNHTVTFGYDANDRLVSRTDQLNRVDGYTYDALGNVLTHTDRRGKVTEYRYDELSRLTFTGYGRTGTAPSFSYESTVTTTYDADNHVASITDSAAPGTGTATFLYNVRDQIAQYNDDRGQYTYVYDDAGRLSSTLIDNQSSINYGYDDAGHITSVTQGSRTATYTYDSAGRPRTVTTPGGFTTTTDYDAAGNVATLTYTRTVGTTTTTLGSLTYSYDALNRRTGVHGPWARLNLPADQPATGYDAANRPATVAGRTQQYDEAGDLTQDGPVSYTWDARGQLATVTDAGGVSTFSYGADGQLAGAVTPAGSTAYRYAGQDLIEETVNGARTTYVPNPLGDGAVTRTTSAGTSAYLVDAQDSTVALADTASGALTASYTYDPLGAATATPGTDPNAIRYTGRPSAPDLPGNLQYNRARFYDPSVARFASEDPAGPTSADANLYNYGGADPVDRTDPTGLMPAFAVGCLAGALLRDLIGGLAGRKHTIGDYVRGGFEGCLLGASLGYAGEEYWLRSAADPAAIIYKWPEGKYAFGWRGFETLNMPLDKWTEEINEAWVQTIIDRKLNVLLLSDPFDPRNWITKDPKTGVDRVSTFLQEIWQLLGADYTFTRDYRWLLPPP